MAARPAPLNAIAAVGLTCPLASCVPGAHVSLGALGVRLPQVALLRQYLDYTEASRKRVGRIGFIQAVLRDCPEVVDNG